MNVLFVCEGNMMRSQMAEAFYNSMTNSHDATSAGAIATLDKHISKRAARAMDELGISTGNQSSKQVTPEMIHEADTVILFPTDFMPDYVVHSSKAEMWNVIDPHYHQEKGMELVRRVRDDIKNSVEKLIEMNG